MRSNQLTKQSSKKFNQNFFYYFSGLPSTAARNDYLLSTWG
ncbi:hypothetical protein APHACPA_1454 [Rickettsia amblyommatis str. Ac/Pa]|uniref:Uncharacterized protein n=1 Tax=Rickettsia amblyommatis str. Ac/Pa TaxID=1359164 RepID=A0A0F3N401_RICAM|nr:hypothetical protein APHACPA_1454 [Rickettsia amblyommatis str. Ac/Pa]